MASFTDEKPLTEADLPATAAKNRFGGKVAVVTGGASGMPVTVRGGSSVLHVHRFLLAVTETS